MTEIEQLSINGSVTETVRFAPDQILGYSIIVSKNATAITARFEANAVVVNIPQSMAADWCEGEDVSLEEDQVIGQGELLKILLEKDFQCLTRRDGEGDMFPNPNEPH